MSLKNPYEKVLWEHSTSPSFSNESDLVKVYVIKDIDTRKRIWIHNILDDNNIPYKIEIVGYWKTRRKYSEKQNIYVEKSYQKKVKNYIKEYNNSKNIVWNDIDEEKMIDDIENSLPQIKCPSCDKDIDFDYVRCPFCNVKL